MSDASSSLIFEKLVAIMGDVPAIPKGQRNKQQGYEFRGIDDLYGALHAIFVKHQVVVLPEVLDAEYEQTVNKNGTLMTDARLTMRYTFATTDGSSVSISTQGESRDAADKASNQAMSGAIKYALLQMFLIPVDVRDADEQSPTIEQETAEEHRARQLMNAAKAEVLKIFDGDADKAQEHWEENIELANDEIVKLAREIAAADDS